MGCCSEFLNTLKLPRGSLSLFNFALLSHPQEEGWLLIHCPEILIFNELTNQQQQIKKEETGRTSSCSHTTAALLCEVRVLLQKRAFKERWEASAACHNRFSSRGPAPSAAACGYHPISMVRESYPSRAQPDQSSELAKEGLAQTIARGEESTHPWRAGLCCGVAGMSPTKGSLWKGRAWGRRLSSEVGRD